MKLVGSRGQQVQDVFYDASGTISSGSAAQLILPQRISTSCLIIGNSSATDMYFETGSARATATLTSGVVTSTSITNAGFGFTIPPIVTFLGGGATTGWNMNNGSFLGCGQPDYQAPAQVATGHAVLSGGAVSSIVVDFGGFGYAKAPYVLLTNSPNDPFGCAVPSATSGVLLKANSAPLVLNGTACTTDPIAVFCTAANAVFSVKWAN